MRNGGAGRTRGAVRRVFGVLLVVVGALLLLGVLIDLAHGDFGSGSDVAGLIFVLLLDLATVSGAVMLLRRPAPRGAPATMAPTPLGFSAGGRDSNLGTHPPPAPVAPPGESDPFVVVDGLPDSATGGPLGATELPRRLVDRSVRHLQPCCQLPFVRTVVALVLCIGGYWLVLRVPNIGGNGPQGFLLATPALPLFYLFGVLLYLPYRIRLRDGILTMGVVGVPRVGRLWRSIAVDLANVEHWDVELQPPLRWHRPRRPAETGPTRRPVNANSMVGPGGRYQLILSAPQGALRARAFPNQIMTGYVVQSSEALGYRPGPVTIRTRRPHDLRAALHRALPDVPQLHKPPGAAGSGQ